MFGLCFLKNKKKQDWQGKILPEVQSERHEIKNTWNNCKKGEDNAENSEGL